MPANLPNYFTLMGQKRALEAYSHFATGTAWSVPHKLDLYRHGFLAFGEGSVDDRFGAFQDIYKALAGYWQVFRPAGKERSWPAQRIFNGLCELDGLGWSTEFSLFNFATSSALIPVTTRLRAFSSIKPNATYPCMTVSKFLHFFNPALFPIYDTEIIEYRVFRSFRTHFKQTCAKYNRPPGLNGADFLANYMLWASELLANAHPDFMLVFCDWLKGELPPKAFDSFGRNALERLFATAFEMTAIGAAFDAEKTTSAQRKV